MTTKGMNMGDPAWEMTPELHAQCAKAIEREVRLIKRKLRFDREVLRFRIAIANFELLVLDLRFAADKRTEKFCRLFQNFPFWVRVYWRVYFKPSWWDS